MWFHSLSVSQLTQTGSVESIGVAHRCVYRAIFQPRFVRLSDDNSASTSTFRCISRYPTHVFRVQYAGRTRVNYSYAYAKSSKVFSQFHWRRSRTSACTAEATMHALGSSTVDLCCLLCTYVVRVLRMSVICLQIYAEICLTFNSFDVKLRAIRVLKAHSSLEIMNGA